KKKKKKDNILLGRETIKKKGDLQFFFFFFKKKKKETRATLLNPYNILYRVRMGHNKPHIETLFAYQSREQWINPVGGNSGSGIRHHQSHYFEEEQCLLFVEYEAQCLHLCVAHPTWFEQLHQQKQAFYRQNSLHKTHKKKKTITTTPTPTTMTPTTTTTTTHSQVFNQSNPVSPIMTKTKRAPVQPSVKSMTPKNTSVKEIKKFPSPNANANAMPMPMLMLMLMPMPMPMPMVMIVRMPTVKRKRKRKRKQKRKQK
ncbi:hypothetical protein RFI_07009, partial [Reticulomyxa filosa]